MTNTKMTFRKLLAMLLVIMIGVTFTPSFAVEAFASTGEDLTLTLVDENKTQYVEGDPILVKATGDAEGAWVGLYLETDVKDDPARGGSHSFRWYYVSERSGYEVDITDDALAQGNPRGPVKPGKYDLMLFGDGGYDKVLKTIKIEVIADPNKDPGNPSDELSLKLVDESKTTYKIGEPVEIIATGIAEGAWVGLYEAGAAKDPNAGGVTSKRWYYTADYNGIKVNIADAKFDGNNHGGLKEGEYELFLFGDGGYGTILKTIPITLSGMVDIDESQFTLEVEKTDYKYKDQIKVKATGRGINEGAWVGLYPADMKEYGDGYLYYYYVRDYEGFFTAIQSKTPGSAAEKYVPHGKYDVVIFADGSYQFPVKKVGITVTRDAQSLKVIREAGCATIGLEYAIYEDGTAEYREIPSMGGHDWEATAVKIAGKKKHEYTCKRAGGNESHKTKVEKCTYGEGVVVAPATVEAAGQREFTCTVCNGTYTESIPKLRLKEEPSITVTKYVYNGKNRQPAVTEVYDIFGKEIPYTVTYPKSSKNVGVYTATVKFTGDYEGSYKLKYTINPKGVIMTKNTKGLKKSFKATWKKAPAQATGYQIAYSTNKNFKNKVFYKKVKGINKTSVTVKKLKAKTKFYVKVRTYKVVNGKTYYSAWSGSRIVNTKAK